jgi:hypothetical protein
LKPATLGSHAELPAARWWQLRTAMKAVIESAQSRVFRDAWS